MKTQVIEAPQPVLSSQDRVADLAREKAGRYRREWEERFSSLLAGRRQWKILCGALVLINAGEGLGMWNVARMSHTELYVLDRSGSAVNYAGPVKPVNMDEATWDLVRVESLKKFLGTWRTVTTDTSAQNLDWDRAFCFVGDGSQARAALARWYEENDPLKRSAKGEVVTVQFLTFDKEGANTYGLWWRETTTTSSGQLNQVQIWRARIVYATKIPTGELARAENGLGILATELTWEPVQK